MVCQCVYPFYLVAMNVTRCRAASPIIKAVTYMLLLSAIMICSDNFLYGRSQGVKQQTVHGVRSTNDAYKVVFQYIDVHWEVAF